MQKPCYIIHQLVMGYYKLFLYPQPCLMHCQGTRLTRMGPRPQMESTSDWVSAYAGGAFCTGIVTRAPQLKRKLNYVSSHGWVAYICTNVTLVLLYYLSE